MTDGPSTDPNAPGFESGPGNFSGSRPRVPIGTRHSRKQTSIIRGLGDAVKQEEVPLGTREEVTDQSTHIIVERKRDGMYYWLIETLDGLQSCEGVYDPALDFTAEHCIDITSKGALDELEKTVKAITPPPKTPPTTPPAAPQTPVKREIIRIVKGDWLTKISEKRWRTWNWQRHLKPTQDTLDKRKQMNRPFDPHWIYPGDTFEVIQP